MVVFFAGVTPLVADGLPILLPWALPPALLSLALGTGYHLAQRQPRLCRWLSGNGLWCAGIHTALGWLAWLGLLPAVAQTLVLSAGMLLAYLPWVAGLLCLLVLALLLHRRGRGLALRRASWFTPIFIHQLVLLIWLVPHFAGTDKEGCERIYEQPGLRPLLDRETLESIDGLGVGYPYDVAVDPDQDAVLVTSKQRLAGHFDLDDPPGFASDALLRLNLAGELVTWLGIPSRGGATMPQSIALDPALQIAALYLVDRHQRHRICTYSYADGGLEELACAIFEQGPGERVAPEPNSLLIDTATHRLVADFYEGSTVRLWEATLPDPRDGSWKAVNRSSGLPDKMFLHGGLRRLYVPTHRGHLYIFDLDDLERYELHFLGQPLTSVAVDPEGRFAYLTGYVTGRLLRFDLEQGRLAGSTWTAQAPRNIAIAPEAGLVYVSGYVPGAVVVHDMQSLERLHRWKVGGLSRSVRWSPTLNQALLCGSCGLLALDIEDLR